MDTAPLSPVEQYSVVPAEGLFQNHPVMLSDGLCNFYCMKGACGKTQYELCYTLLSMPHKYGWVFVLV